MTFVPASCIVWGMNETTLQKRVAELEALNEELVWILQCVDVDMVGAEVVLPTTLRALRALLKKAKAQ